MSNYDLLDDFASCRVDCVFAIMNDATYTKEDRLQFIELLLDKYIDLEHAEAEYKNKEMDDFDFKFLKMLTKTMSFTDVEGLDKITFKKRE